jgi:hypothetical protein
VESSDTTMRRCLAGLVIGMFPDCLSRKAASCVYAPGSSVPPLAIDLNQGIHRNARGLHLLCALLSYRCLPDDLYQ